MEIFVFLDYLNISSQSPAFLITSSVFVSLSLRLILVKSSLFITIASHVQVNPLKVTSLNDVKVMCQILKFPSFTSFICKFGNVAVKNPISSVKICRLLPISVWPICFQLLLFSLNLCTYSVSYRNFSQLPAYSLHINLTIICDLIFTTPFEFSGWMLVKN